MTPTERMLWSALRNQQFDGLKFRRQQPVEPYVVDLCCLEHRLIVELDGVHHAEQVEYDDARTAYLAEFGFTVLRFRNAEIFDDPAGVLKRIREAARTLGAEP